MGVEKQPLGQGRCHHHHHHHHSVVCAIRKNSECASIMKKTCVWSQGIQGPTLESKSACSRTLPPRSPNPNPWICTHPGLPAIRGYSLAHPCPAVYLRRTAGIRANPKSQQRRPANGTENSARGTMQTGEDLAPALQCARPQWVCLDRGLLSLRRGRWVPRGLHLRLQV